MNVSSQFCLFHRFLNWMSFSSDIVYHYTSKQGGFLASSEYLKILHFKIVRGLPHWAPTRDLNALDLLEGFPYPYLCDDKTQLKNSLGAARRAQKVSELICGLKNLLRQFNRPGHFFQVSPVQNRCTPKNF